MAQGPRHVDKIHRLAPVSCTLTLKSRWEFCLPRVPKESCWAAPDPYVRAIIPFWLSGQPEIWAKFLIEANQNVWSQLKKFNRKLAKSYGWKSYKDLEKLQRHNSPSFGTLGFPHRRWWSSADPFVAWPCRAAVSGERGVSSICGFCCPGLQAQSQIQSLQFRVRMVFLLVIPR